MLEFLSELKRVLIFTRDFFNAFCSGALQCGPFLWDISLRIHLVCSPCVPVLLFSSKALQCFSVFCLRTFKLFIPMFLSLLFLTNVMQLSFL